MQDEPQKLPAQVVESLLAALLAVNRYPLEKAWKLLPHLREEGLTSPVSVAAEDLGQLTVRLARAGYDRGLVTGILAQRVQHLMVAITAGRLDELPAAVQRNDAKATQRMLCEISGIGPQVAHSAWLLLKEGPQE
jgi:hypothetical protein